MTILGQQALLEEVEDDRYLACRHCGDAIENNGVRSVDKYISSCSGYIDVGPNETLHFEGNGYTEHGDPVKTLGYECESCGTFARSLDKLVEWRTDDA